MVTLAHTRFFSVDFKFKYRLNFSFKKNHFFLANPFFLPPKPGSMPMFFRKYACLLSKCAWKEIKAW